MTNGSRDDFERAASKQDMTFHMNKQETMLIKYLYKYKIKKLKN